MGKHGEDGWVRGLWFGEGDTPAVWTLARNVRLGLVGLGVEVLGGLVPGAGLEPALRLREKGF